MEIMKEISEAEAREITDSVDFDYHYAYMEKHYGPPVKYYYNDKCYWVELEDIDGTRMVVSCKWKHNQSETAHRFFESIGFSLNSYERRMVYLGVK